MQNVDLAVMDDDGRETEAKVGQLIKEESACEEKKALVRW